MSTLFLVGIGLLALLGFVSVICSALMLVVIWVGRGEPDVNGDPERDADPNEPNALPPWDAELMCAWCGEHLSGPLHPPNGATFFKLCDRCRVEAEREIKETIIHEEVK